jgi:hypothetical protein
MYIPTINAPINLFSILESNNEDAESHKCILYMYLLIKYSYNQHHIIIRNKYANYHISIIKYSTNLYKL